MLLSLPVRAARVAALFALLPLAAMGCQSSADSHTDVQADNQMSGALTESLHMTLTPMRAPTHADSVRAAAGASDGPRRGTDSRSSAH